MNEDMLWPSHAKPADLTAIEAVALADRGLPDTTYALLHRAATRWPERVAVAVLPEAAPLPTIPGVRVEYLAHLAATKDPAAFAGTLPKSSDLAAVFHTGGTTGAPKQAGHTHANEVCDAWMLAVNSVFDADSTVFAALPLFHVNALVVTLLAPLFKGQLVVWAGPLGYREPALLGQFWKILDHYRIAAMSAVPTVYATLARTPVDADISSLRVAMVGASPLPAAVRDAFHANTRVHLLEGYGLTEGTCASARSFPDVRRPGSVGQRLPYQRVRIVRVAPDGQWLDVPTGQAGLLLIGGPTVFPGYLTGRDGDSYVLDGLGKHVEGWLDTGDLARRGSAHPGRDRDRGRQCRHDHHCSPGHRHEPGHGRTGPVRDRLAARRPGPMTPTRPQKGTDRLVRRPDDID